ncbi:hypothetical protein BGZ96_005331 [Linnemannia gamsii]|uniref:Uncharacterized protein n=1 Tax=Linnemannia gamsii TaxID=64522 RepID=A0ABQ7KH55_9FUNG|nr:hypothetical protein BGZ96_005331 [Linnemannia gamsii]
MADIQTKVVEETQEIIVVSEDATATATTTTSITTATITDANDEPALTPEVTEPAPIAPAPVAPTTTVITEVKQESRLSLAFKKISGGCGLCFSPLKNGPTDYHNLVETPTDEDEPHRLLPDGSHDNSGNASAPLVITDDYKREHSTEGEIAIASSSTDSHYLHRDEVHEEVKSRDLAVVEEFTTTVMEEHNIVMSDERQPEMQEVQFSTQIIDATSAPATFVEEIVEDIVVDDSSLPIVAAAVVVEATSPKAEEPVAAVTAVPTPASAQPVSASLPASPATTRSSKSFSKKLSKPKRSPSASPATSTSNSSSSLSASSPTATSPLRERLNRFAKIIRPSETNSSIHSKVESLKVSTAPSTPAVVEEAVIATAITAEPEEVIISKTTTTVPLTPVSPVHKEFSVPSLRSDATPPLPPQPQQHNNNRRNSLAVDTLVANNKTTTTTTTTHTTTTTAPVAIPSSWSHSPTTLHQRDASTANSTSGQSLSRNGRASTMDSATEVGSLSSNSNSNSNEQLSSIATSAPGKDGLKANRRKSVLKKLGKIINTMNTNNRKGSMDSAKSAEKNEKRTSRQGSMTLTSPLESEENFGF